MADVHRLENQIIAVSPKLFADFDEILHCDAYWTSAAVQKFKFLKIQDGRWPAF